MKETKNARFRRVAEARVNKTIRMLRLLGNCSGTNTYAYDADAGHRFVSAHHSASAGRHTSSSRRLCRYDLSGHQSVSTAGW